MLTGCSIAPVGLNRTGAPTPRGVDRASFDTNFGTV
jgi:hypothetical protein